MPTPVTPDVTGQTVHGGPVAATLGHIARIAGGVVHSLNITAQATHIDSMNEVGQHDVDAFAEHQLKADAEWETRTFNAPAIQYAPGTKIDATSLTLMRPQESRLHNIGSGASLVVIKNDGKQERIKWGIQSFTFLVRNYNASAALNGLAA